MLRLEKNNKTSPKSKKLRKMSNQAWLEAYEAQKAKRLESLKGNKDPFSLSGLSSQKTPKPKPKETKVEVKPKPVPQIPASEPPTNSTNTRFRKSSIDNSAHERIEAEKLASIEAFSQPMSSFPDTNRINSSMTQSSKIDQNVSKTEDKKRKIPEEPSVHSLFKKVRNDAKKEVKDWQQEYEERKKLAMAALNK